MPFHVTSFYHFVNPRLTEEGVQAQKHMLTERAKELGLRGLVIMGVEGYNLTVSGEAGSIETFKKIFTDELQIKDLIFKDSLADVQPFRMFKVAIRPEI